MEQSELDRIRARVLEFLEHREGRNYSPETRKRNQWDLEYFLEFLKTRDEESLAHITAETLHRYQERLYGRAGRGGKPLSLTSQLNALVSVRVFFQWLTRRGFLLADPSAGLALPRIKDALPRGVMTLRQVEKVLSRPDVDTPLGLRDKAVMELLYSTGIRNKELRGLKLYDVDTSEGEVRVREGKGGRGRVLPLGEVAANYVELYRKEARPKILGRREDPGYLFLGRLGGRLSVATLCNAITRHYGREAGLPWKLTPHAFRHTCATHLLRGHANIRHIQALLGHKSLKTTQVYTRVEVGDLKREVRRCHPRERAK